MEPLCRHRLVLVPITAAHPRHLHTSPRPMLTSRLSTPKPTPVPSRHIRHLCCRLSSRMVCKWALPRPPKLPDRPRLMDSVNVALPSPPLPRRITARAPLPPAVDYSKAPIPRFRLHPYQNNISINVLLLTHPPNNPARHHLTARVSTHQAPTPLPLPTSTRPPPSL
jgi:hypothetical protein